VTIDAFCAICGEGIVWYDEDGWRHEASDEDYDHLARPRQGSWSRSTP
jgi:hypothetical protein